MVISGGEIERGRGYWKLNTTHISMPDYRSVEAEPSAMSLCSCRFEEYVGRVWFRCVHSVDIAQRRAAVLAAAPVMVCMQECQRFRDARLAGGGGQLNVKMVNRFAHIRQPRESGLK